MRNNMNVMKAVLKEEDFVKVLICQDEFNKNLNKLKQNKKYYDEFNDFDNIDKQNVESLIKYIQYLHNNIISLTEQKIGEMGVIINLNKGRFKYLYDNYDSGAKTNDYGEETKE